MQKLFMAHVENTFADAIIRQLKGAYEIELCNDTNVLLERIDSFDPEILLIDIALCGAEAFSVLHILRSTGRSMQIVVLSVCNQHYVLNSLSRLRVSSVFMKPCKPSALVSHIYEISAGDIANDAWHIESEADRILLQLGFRMGPSRYRCVYHSVLSRYRLPESYLTKELYPEVARICGGSAIRIEKAIRDAIGEAWRHGDKLAWRLYFPPMKGGIVDCPSNEVFISRIAAALHHRDRLFGHGTKPERIAK